jgi:phage terminase small subunit
MGRRRRSTSLLESSSLLQAERPGPKRRIPRAAFAPGVPEMPEAVADDERARAHWNRLVKTLSESSVLTPAFGDMLGILCVSLSDLDRLRMELADNSTSVALRQLVDRKTHVAHKLLREFGLSPLSAPLVKGAPVTPPDPFDRFLEERSRKCTSWRTRRWNSLRHTA